MLSIEELIELKEKAIRMECELQTQRLKDEMEFGSVGDMNWLKERLGIKSSEVLRERLLYPFRKELEGKIVYYSDKNGVPWGVNKSPFNKWLVDFFERIEWGGR
ncbi:Prophage pi2 protein 07 [Globicatella sulfidifaciens DSM 15739]|uniref:Prophage pi2 protein 07 n=1 Tax=Globicatella sulfidifaciens DSM 15739 TaxID=1121925 RepID=A0A1T4LB21_9LACT|nr:Prophage pi2 protein 07 [Globicatella sulfidifaciens DSM 15739]